MKKRVVFHGFLRKLCPQPVEISASSAIEAIEGVTRQIKSFRPRLNQPKPEVRVLGMNSVAELRAHTDVEEIHVVPAFSGGKKGGLFTIVLGAVLIGASFLIGPGAVIGLGALGELAIGSMVFNFGLALLAGGLLQLMSPSPKIDQGSAAAEIEASKYLGAPANTAAVGTRIPVLYGTIKHYGHFVSFDIDAKQVPV